MDSLASRADAIRNAVTSISTCNPAISATLKELLQHNDSNNDTVKPVPRPRTTKITRAPSRTNANSITRNITDNGRSLTAKERAVLATQVITASLKVLGDAAKTVPSQSSDTHEPPKNVLAKSAPRNILRRSNSAPMKPIQPRTLNRTTTSPSVQKIIGPPTPVPSSTGCLSLIECVRTSFSVLSALESSKTLNLPELQWETGMSSFINKLIGLNHFDLAIKELRILKRRLERVNGDDIKNTATRAKAESSLNSRTLSELLDFTKVPISGPTQLGLVISCQLQVLRIAHGLKKSSHLESMLPLLRESCPNSPIKLLLLSLKDDNPDQTKCARNLDSLSQSLLSLTPGVSTKDDDFAVEPKLYPNPKVALEVQALGLATRLQSWSVSGHRGDVDKDILSPLSKCLGAFVRRAPSNNMSIIFSAFSHIWKRIEKLGLRPTESSRSPLAAIYQILAVVSRESGNTNEAKKWVSKIKSLIDPNEDSAARCCATAAQLLALSLKQWSQVNENLLMEVLDGLRGPLGGTTAEMDDLLVSVCLLRKSVMGLVVEKLEGSSLSQATIKILESFIFQLPRFTLRWLGKPPSSVNGAKDILRFEQRRGTLSTHLPQILDSALLFAKLLSDDGQLAWDTLDSMLQDCLTILEYMGDIARPGTKINPTPSYHVKISHFYYQQHVVLRKTPTKTTETTSLKALRKSIDSVKNRSEAEQSRAQLLIKWERFAELCRASGRLDDAIDALRSIRDHLIRQEVVSKVTESLATEPWWMAWRLNSDVDQLSRTVCNLAKLDRTHNDWTWLLSGLDKATALEHDLYAIILKDSKYQQEADLSGATVKALLQVYSAEQYPIRRLRTLLHLLAVKIGTQDELAELRVEIEAVLEVIGEGALANDSGLVRYISHLQALAACILGLATPDIDTPPVKEALANWKAIVSKCDSAEQLSAHIDNPSQLLTILRSLVDFARIEGLETLQTDILELSISLSKLTASGNFEVLINQSIALCQRHLSHGWSSKAEKLLQDNEELVSRPDVDRELVVNFHLAAAEYHLSLGAMDKAEQHMSNARDAEITLSYEPGSKKGKSANKRLTIAQAYSLMSNLALERGDCYNALRFARTAVRKLFHDWSRLDEMRNISTDVTVDDSSQAETSEKDQSLNSSYVSQSDLPRAATGPEYWALSHPLFRFLLQLSSIYAHVGVYQETLYYAEQAQKVAKSIGSAVYMSQALAWLAHVWLMAGKPGKANELATEMKPLSLGLESTYQNAKVLCRLSSIYGELEDLEAQVELLSKAESMLEVLSVGDKGTKDSAANELESKMTKLSLEEKPISKVPVRRTTVAKASRATRTVAKKPAAKKAIPVPLIEVPMAVKSEDIQLSFLRGLILQSKSAILIAKDDWSAAVTTLRTAYELSRIPADVSQTCFLMGVALIRQSLEQIGQDAVFSVIQDSTLSFPSVTRSPKERTLADRLSITQTPAPRKGRGPSKRAQNDTRSFIEKLREAQGHLLTAHSIASLNGDGDLVHRIAVALQSVVILLSNTNSSNPAASHPFHATCAVELARNLTWRRERKTVHLDASTDSKIDWPILTNDTGSRRESLGLSLDMDCLLKDFVDIVPKSWNIVSLSLSHDERDLCITKLQGGQDPFGIRLPLERATLRDADLEVLSFQQGRAELFDIIEVANRTCHDARDMSQKGAKSAWWAEREELDERLKNLMESIEQSWLAGFRGIFSQHRRRADLITRFQKSFMKILDKHLPSRRKVHGKRAATTPTTRVNLDPRVYDMIIGLGDPTAPEGDLDEPLMDLLYYIVDILQFHGERNAYDEVDFDEMVIDTYSALNSYYVAAKGIKEPEESTHTILVLDKYLHPFPFEALPCMQGLAVSRVFSLDCLRRQILEAKLGGSVSAGKEDEESSTNAREGHYISINSGTYILNPNCDLKNTQATFGDPLSTLPPTWNSIEMREPTEAEFESALTEKDLMLYFGHGSGAQYIRGRSIRKMDKCRAVALLMGCSSASLAEVGRFESYGTVRNYMLSGSPAVVGTLWDVTDRDIDRFAGRVFEEWGLMPKGTFVEDAKGKRVVKSNRKRIGVVEHDGEGPTSLTEAVCKAKDACRFRYLTAAAVCVYGIPVYLKDN